MRRTLALTLLAGSLGAVAPVRAAAQEAADGFIAVGEMAPDFALPGATRYGLLAAAGAPERLPRRDRRPRLLLQGPDQGLNGPDDSVP